MQLIEAVASINASTDPNPEEAVNSQLEWEHERRGIANGTVCDDGFRWSDEIDFQHLFGRPSKSFYATHIKPNSIEDFDRKVRKYINRQPEGI